MLLCQLFLNVRDVYAGICRHKYNVCIRIITRQKIIRSTSCTKTCKNNVIIFSSSLISQTSKQSLSRIYLQTKSTVTNFPKPEHSSISLSCSNQLGLNPNTQNQSTIQKKHVSLTVFFSRRKHFQIKSIRKHTNDTSMTGRLYNIMQPDARVKAKTHGS